MRYLSVCSGIEAATVAWHPLGWECAGAAEIEPFPCQVLAQRLGAGRPRYMPDPDEPGLKPKDAKARAAAIKAMNSPSMRWGNEIVNFGDFSQIRENDVGPIDLLVGGTPCQSFSIAGKRLGLDDPRGNLTLEFFALARRLRATWVVWENVPGVLSHDEGRTLGAVLGIMAECGFERWAYRILDAQYVRVGRFGRAVPQRRRRLVLVGYSGTAGFHPRAVLFDRESLRWNPAPRRQAGESVAALTANGVGTCGADDNQGQVGHLIASTGNVPHCLNAGGMGRQDFETETLIAHSLRGEGFDASEDGTGRGTPLVAVERVADTLTSNGDAHTGYRDEKGLVAFSIMPMNSGKDYKAREVDVAQPLMAGGPVGGNQGGDFVRQASAVRRLTPRECERLQGFPDDYTLIPWRGKPADLCPDGP